MKFAYKMVLTASLCSWLLLTNISFAATSNTGAGSTTGTSGTGTSTGTGTGTGSNTGSSTGSSTGTSTGTGTGTSVGTADSSSIIQFLTSAIQTKNQADAEFVFMDPPGKTTTAKASGTSAGVVEQPLEELRKTKELTDINWGLYATPRTGESVTGTMYSYFLDKHKNYFCSPSSQIEQVFTDSQACKDNTSKMEHADLRISSLLNPLAYSDADKLLADDVIRMLTVPFPDDNLSTMVRSGLKDTQSVSAVAEAMSKHAVLNVARNSFNEMWAMRVPKVTGASGVGAAGAQSVLSIMENESGRRFKDDKWYGLVDQSSSEALLREMVQMEAFKLWMDYQKFRQNERLEALLAAMVSSYQKQSMKFEQAFSQATLAAQH